VIGAPAAAQNRATELRMMGFATWTATNEAELHWLLEQAWIRPGVSVVELTGEGPERAALSQTLAALATLARLPVVLVGVDEREERQFPGVVAALPAAIDVQTLVERMPRDEQAELSRRVR
jgi:hypothetical protein